MTTAVLRYKCDLCGHVWLMPTQAILCERTCEEEVAKAIEARSAETGNTGSDRRAKALSATPICPNNIAKESEGAE